MEALFNLILDLTNPEKNEFQLTILFILLFIFTTFILKDKNDIIEFIEKVYPNRSFQILEKSYIICLSAFSLFSKFNLYTWLFYLMFKYALYHSFVNVFIFQWIIGILLIFGLFYSFYLKQKTFSLKNFINQHITNQKFNIFWYNAQIFTFLILLSCQSLNITFLIHSGPLVAILVVFMIFTGKTALKDLLIFIENIIKNVKNWCSNKR